MRHHKSHHLSPPNKEPSHDDMVYKDTGLDPPEVNDTKTLNRQSSLISLYQLDQASALIRQ